MKLRNFVFIIAMGFFASCSNNEAPKEETPAAVEPAKEVCLYSVQKDSTKVFWTAYKLSQKTPVTGRFMMPVLSGDTTSENAFEVFKNAKIVVSIANINSKDAERDKKITESFFGKMMNTTEIMGQVKSASGNGKGVISIKMNEVEKEVVATFEMEGDWVKCTADINVEEFNGADALKSLNTVCKERHTGTDGVNKLWPDVRIMVQALVRKECK